MTKRFFTMFSFLFLTGLTFGQVTNISLELQFNESTSNYDCFLNINEGQAKSLRERFQSSAQISIITPVESVVTVAQSYMPLENNHNLNSVKPVIWDINATQIVTAPGIANGFYGFAPKLSPVGLYNEITKGDRIKLFSVRVSPVPTCIEDVRLFENGIDLPSSNVYMEGLNFNNAFTMGGLEKLYFGNARSADVYAPNSSEVGASVIINNSSIQLMSGSWSNAATFEWNGPNGFKSNQQNPIVKNAKEGIYTLTVTNERGCAKSTSVNYKANSVFALEGSNSSVENNIDVNTAERSSTSNIFPNPAVDHFNLKINTYRGASVKVDVRDSVGKVVMNNLLNEVANSNVIEFKANNINLGVGVYFVAVDIDGQVTNHKLLIVK